MSERVYYPLTASQGVLAAYASAFPVLDALTELAELRFTAEIDEARLLEAIRIGAERQYYSSIRFHQQEDGSFVQYHYEGEAAPVMISDVPDLSDDERDKLFLDWAHEAFPGTFTDIQLYSIRLLHYADGQKGLFFCFQHFIMDGFSAVQFLYYIGQVYLALLHGTELPKSAPEPWKLLEQEQKYFAGRYEKDLAAVMKRFETEPQFTTVDGLGSPAYVEGKRYGKMRDMMEMTGLTINYSLPRALIDAMTAKAAALNISPRCFFTLAARSYLAHVCQTEDVYIELANNCRGTLYEKQCGFLLIDATIFRTILSGERSFTEGLTEIADVQNEYLRAYKIPRTGVLAALNERFDVPADCNYQTFCLSYFQPVNLGTDELSFTARYVNNGWSPAPVMAQYLPEDGKGGMAANYIYSPLYTKRESVEAYHAFMLRFLENGLNAPELSINALIEKSL